MAPGLGPSRVLLVEDDELNRALVRTLLRRATDQALRGVALVEAASLAEARARLAEAPVDLLVLDLGLLDGSGLLLLDELDQGAGSRPAVIVVSGAAPPPQHAAAVAAGCDAFLAKPYAAADLLNLMSAHLAPPDLPDGGPAA